MDHHHRSRQGESNDPRKGNPLHQETINQDDIYWYKVDHPSFSPPPPPMPENNNQFSFPAAAAPENRLPPTFSHQIPINPYHPIPKTTFPNAAYDPFLEVDFSRLNLSTTPSRSNSQGLGFVDRSNFHEIPSDFSLNAGFSQLDYADMMNLQRMRVESAVRGQTDFFADPYGFLGLPEDPLGQTDFFRTGRSLSYGQYGNGSAYGMSGLNRFSSSRVNENGFYEPGGYGNGAPTGSSNRNGSSSSAYDIGYGASGRRNGFPAAYDTGSRKGFQIQSGYGSGYGAAPATSRNGSRVENGLHRRGRPGTGISRPERSSPGGSRSPSANGGGSGPLGSVSERLNARPFEQWRGNIVFLAKDQHGYAFLKKKIEEKKKEEVEMIFSEVKDHVRELMVDQYGNYPIQKIFEVCNEDQMTQMLLLVVSEEHYLMSICVDTHGTRAMQKMLENLTTPEQVSLVMSVISRITLVLTKSMSGYRVIESCLKSFTNDQNRQLLSVIAENCADIAMDQAGCCVLQQCVLYSEGEARERLTRGIIENTMVLSENIYGNYVVQYILGLQVPQYTEQIMAQLAGSYVSLSMNKYGSNVVERCIRDSNEEQAARIIREIYDSPNFLMVLQDPFGNYVTQTALEVAKGGLRLEILALIQHHHPYLHSHPHGKRVLAKLRGNGKHHRGYYEFRR